MKTMQIFGKDLQHIDETDENKSAKGWSTEQNSYIDKLKSADDVKCLPYLKQNMTLRHFEIVHMASNLGVEYAEQLTSVELTEEAAEVVLYGYTKEFNVFEQAAYGESPENLTALIDLVSKGNVDIMDFFDEKGEYLDYARIKEQLKY